MKTGVSKKKEEEIMPTEATTEENIIAWNVKSGRKKRFKTYIDKKALENKIKLFCNTICKLKRKNKQLSEKITPCKSPKSCLLDAISPSAKKHAKCKLELSNCGCPEEVKTR